MKKIKVAIVDDHALIREGIKKLLELEDAFDIVALAGDGYEALELIKTTRPDVVLLDINMPRMNGLEFLSALRRDPELKRSVVFVLTTSNRDEDIMAAYDGQIAGYLLKSKVSEDFLAFVKLLNLYQVMIEIPR